MKVYIDMSYYMTVSYISGIQRVVREVVLRMLPSDRVETVLLQHIEGGMQFRVLKTSGVLEVMSQTGAKIIGARDLEPGSVFLDIDSVWPIQPKRSILYPLLRKQGVKVVPFIQDILPITHPKYFAGKGDWNFAGYIYAVITYSDAILTSAEATKSAIAGLMKEVGAKEIPIYAVQLGGNLQAADYDVSKVDKEAIAFVKKNPDYVLMVGTIEPRKNHQVIMKAFRDGGLFEKGIGLVFAGRYGWSAEETHLEIRKLSATEKRFAFLEGKNNETIHYLYDHAHIVAFPSFEEGYGLPIVEALTYKIPVIAADRPVLREVGGENCRYCDPEKPEEWAKAIQQSFEDKEDYAAWKERLDSFTPLDWDTVTDRVIEVLRKAAGESSGTGFPAAQAEEEKRT